MRALHLFFRIHRPYTLKLDEHDPELFGGEAEFREADRTEYQPFFALLERTTQKYENFKVSLSISGVWLEQAKRWSPDLIRRLKRLINLGKVELLLTPYHYNLSVFYNKSEFESELKQMESELYQTFGVTPEVLAMPELIYNDKIATWAREHKLKGVLIGNADTALDYRSSNQIFEAADHQDIKLLVMNTRFSGAIRFGTSLAMVESEKAKEKFVDNIDPLAEPEHYASHQKATAAEFVKGMTGLSRPATRKKSIDSILPRSGTGQMVFSARRYQKELELETLRGNLVTIALDTGIFSEFRSADIVRFFDEFFLAWQKDKNNKILAASAMLEAASPSRILSIKSTIDWRSSSDESVGGIALLKDVCYCPPRWLATARQISLEHRLYTLLGQVLLTKDKKLYQDFEKFTTLDYIIPINPSAPHLLHGELLPHADAAHKRFTTALDRFEKIIEKSLPEPLKITASAGKAQKKSEAKDTEKPEDFSVKVHIIPRKKPADKAAKLAKKSPETDKTSKTTENTSKPKPKTHKINTTGESITEKVNVSHKKAAKKPAKNQIEDAGDWDELIWDSENWVDTNTDDERLADYIDSLDEENPDAELEAAFRESEIEDDIEETDPIDDAASEVQVLAQRLSRQQAEMTKNIEILAEGEVVEDEPKPPKKSKKHRK